MVEVFVIDSNAKILEVDVESIDTSRTLVIIDHKEKIIYLWRGKKSSLFEKLMGTRVIAKLSHSYPDYRIKPIAEGHEPPEFTALINRAIREKVSK